MKSVICGLVIISICLLLKGCNTTEPPNGLTINLTLEDFYRSATSINPSLTDLQFIIPIILRLNLGADLI
jgi:hypothetical protein